MTIKQALTILKPEKPSEEALKKAWKKACFNHHPDRGGDLELMKLVNLAYETLQKCDRWWTPMEAKRAAKETSLTESFKKRLQAVRHFENINIEIIGSWLWVSGNTKVYKEQLKGLGFRFSRNKMSWYYHEDSKYKKKHGKKWKVRQRQQKEHAKFAELWLSNIEQQQKL